MVDVGGQRAERRKWIHCFDGINAIIYLAALDEYNMTLQEDNTTNRLDESLRLFQEITTSQWFGDKVFILFLNKSDLFKEKIKRHPLYKYYEVEKSDVKEYDDAVNFIGGKYREIYGHEKNKMFVHVTNALDTTNCKKVFDCVKFNVLDESMYGAGW